MKTKSKPLVRGKSVHYFNHKYGVVNGRSKSGLKIVSGLMSAVIVFGGLGVAATKVIDLHKQSSPSYQREDVAVGADKKDNATDNLKNVSTKAREDKELAKRIKEKLKDVPGGQKWSVYVRDLNSDRMASVDADELREASGFANLFMTAPLESKMPSTKWNYRASSDQTIAQCVDFMIRKNDDDCARGISRYVNFKSADSVLNGLGFKKTTIEGKEKKTTAREMGDLLFRLQNSQILSDKGRRAVFDGLYAQESREGIPAGCDQKDCLIANITSQNGEDRSDAAIVTSGDTQYVVVIMSEDARWSQIADISHQIYTLLRP